MTEVEHMVRHISIRYSTKIKKICEPLTVYFGINHFFMNHTMADGRFFSFGSKLDMHEYYYSGKQFLVSPLHRHPNLIKGSGFYSYYNFSDKDFKTSMENVAKTVCVEPIAGIIIKKNNSLIRFGYCVSSQNNTRMVWEFVHNNIPLLERFNAYFVAEMQEEIIQAKNSAISLPEKMGSLYNTPLKDDFFCKMPEDNKISFLRKIGVSQENITKREVDYLKYIAKGLTSKQIAELMHLSQRTVEHAIANLKEKLDCESKSKLVEIARLF